MKFDLFLALCQAEVDGFMPSERQMYENFFSQVRLGDALGFECAWVGESHFSSRVQQRNPDAVIPHFKGEVALNSDILHLAGKIYQETTRIEVGSAIRNILCNGGPLAHAEAIKMFLSIHGLREKEQRRLHIGFASGRFAYSNRPYGISPRNLGEKELWPELKAKLFVVATEIFMRGLGNDAFSSDAIVALRIKASECADAKRWQRALAYYQDSCRGAIIGDELEIPHFWVFENLAIFPFAAPLSLLDLTIGSYDPSAQAMANRFFPTKVFNLSYTSTDVIEATHQRMQKLYHPDGGSWRRDYLPRTALIFINNDAGLSSAEQCARAKERASKTLATYWRAMQGTVSAEKIDEELHNALWGNPAQIIEQLQQRYHHEDRLMCWFDFCCHDNELVSRQMQVFMEEVAPLVRS
jgi:alkanesulfonate monooxygenase SsuD/methylene tetrahydromethanopterin reductase-like flavin-dependent oxidoreductase (luciferase family)